MPIGQTNNPHGRPVGKRNRRTEAIWNTLEEKGDLDPAIHLSSLVTDPNTPADLRAAAANYLLPYKYSKCGSVVPLRYIPEPVTLPCPSPTTTQELDKNIAHINQLFADGTLDAESTALMLAGQREHTVSFKAREDTVANTDIHIIGGLPDLPGTNITMPKLNGHETLALINPNDPPICPPQDPDTEPAIPPENDPPQDEGTSP